MTISDKAMPYKQIMVFLITLLIAFPAWAGDLNSELMGAVQDGDKAKVQALLDRGADVNAKNRAGWTALFFARDADVAKVLLDRGADVNAKDFIGETALQIATEYGHTDVARLLQQAAQK